MLDYHLFSTGFARSAFFVLFWSIWRSGVDGGPVDMALLGLILFLLPSLVYLACRRALLPTLPHDLPTQLRVSPLNTPSLSSSFHLPVPSRIWIFPLPLPLPHFISLYTLASKTTVFILDITSDPYSIWTWFPTKCQSNDKKKRSNRKKKNKTKQNKRKHKKEWRSIRCRILSI